MSNSSLHILVADDHALFREGLSLVLQSLDNAQVHEVRSGQEVEQRLKAQPPIDLLLLDYNMPGVCSHERIRNICNASTLTAVIVISGDDKNHNIEQCLNAGARGFIPKDSSSQVMLNAIQLVLSGEQYVPAKMTQTDHPIPSHPAIQLTPRQTEILRYIIDGESNKMIAYHLDVSENTVKQHVSALFRKLNVSSRTQAIKLATQRS